VAAVLFSVGDAAGAVQLAGECARTTHQSPFVIDACRYYAAMLLGALRGATPEVVLDGLYEPVSGFWSGRPLRPALANMARSRRSPEPEPGSKKPQAPDVVAALARVRTAVAEATDFEDAIRRACAGALEPGLEAALVGTLMGAFHGAESIPAQWRAALARVEVIESFARRLVQSGRGEGAAAQAGERQP
jgi:ADP-ribosylglycohydrolase